LTDVVVAICTAQASNDLNKKSLITYLRSFNNYCLLHALRLLTLKPFALCHGVQKGAQIFTKVNMTGVWKYDYSLASDSGVDMCCVYRNRNVDTHNGRSDTKIACKLLTVLQKGRPV
jgi:hypothetical protein